MESHEWSVENSRNSDSPGIHPEGGASFSVVTIFVFLVLKNLQTFVVGWWKLWATRLKSCPSDGDYSFFNSPHTRQDPRGYFWVELGLMKEIPSDFES